MFPQQHGEKSDGAGGENDARPCGHALFDGADIRSQKRRADAEKSAQEKNAGKFVRPLARRDAGNDEKRADEDGAYRFQADPDDGDGQKRQENVQQADGKSDGLRVF